jgi:predicted transposase YdaD
MNIVFSFIKTSENSVFSFELHSPQNSVFSFIKTSENSVFSFIKTSENSVFSFELHSPQNSSSLCFDKIIINNKLIEIYCR